MPKPPRNDVLPSPKISHANPTRGPKSLLRPLPRDEAGANPPGPQTLASCAKAISAAVSQTPTVPTGALACCSQPCPVAKLSITLFPGPLRKVVAVFASSLCRWYLSQRNPRFKVKRFETFQSSCRYRPASMFLQCRTFDES